MIMEHADQDTEKPKMRLIKGGRERPRSGVIAVEDKDGKTFYRCSCDRCNAMVTLPFRPGLGREVVCNECRWVARKGKPSTRVIRRKDRAQYLTECDTCGTVSKTMFLPKKDRLFLCDTCKRETNDAAGSLGEPEKREPVPEIREPAPTRTSKPEEPTAQADPAESEVKPVYEVPCGKCGTVMSLRFKPRNMASFLCPNCYKAPTRSVKQAEKKEGTRILYNIECAVCGKKEVVDFVPKFGSDAVCSDCFKSKKRRR